MPEWYLVVLLLAGISVVGGFWHPALLALPLLILSIAIPVVQAAWSASKAEFTTPNLSRWERFKLYCLTTYLYCMQPVARLWGRLDNGLTPWRRRSKNPLLLPISLQKALWSEGWRSSDDWLLDVCESLDQEGAIAVSGNDFDAWDIEIRGGLTSSLRMLMAIEEHGGGKQLVRLRSWPNVSPTVISTLGVMILLTLLAVHDQSLVAATSFGAGILALTTLIIWDCSIAISAYFYAIKQLAQPKGRELIQ